MQLWREHREAKPRDAVSVSRGPALSRNAGMPQVFSSTTFVCMISFSQSEIQTEFAYSNPGRGIMDLDHVNKAIAENYWKLRTLIGSIALAFPFVLFAWGAYWGFTVPPTLSDYYYAMDPVGERIDPFPVRLWFCGILFAVGFFLYKYEGFSKNESRWLNAAGAFAVCVAVFPMARHLQGQDHGDWDWVVAWTGWNKLSLHGISAFLAFFCIAVVIVWYADSTLSELKKPRPTAYKWFKATYRSIAILMVLSIVVAIIWHDARHILWAECFGIWAFAGYWFVKNKELTEVAKVLKARAAPLHPRTEADLADKL
jgi:hypothetical protein